MTKQVDILLKYLSEQISIEEQLYSSIQEQLIEIEDTDYEEAKKILLQTSKLLEKHFMPLNKLLDKFEKIPKSSKYKIKEKKITHVAHSSTKNSLPSGYVASLLCDDYASLNRITMSNTLLHTIALALEAKDLADLSLAHLENLAPLVVGIGELVPTIAAQELCKHSPQINPGIASTAIENTKKAWQKI